MKSLTMEKKEYAKEDEAKHEKGDGSIREVFVQSSSLHGMNKLHKDSNLLRRTIWMILIIVCAVSLVYIVAKEIQNYYEYPTTTNIKINRFTEMPFPAVTACNLSPYNKTKLDSLGEKYMNFLMKYTTSWGHFADPINMSDPDYQTSLFTDPITPESLAMMAMDPDMMFQGCTFDGHSCGTSPTLISTDIGPCYTFNADGKLTTKKIGALNNLEVQIFLAQNHYFYSRYLGSGIKVLVHDPSEIPDVMNTGFIVPPGFMAHAAIQTSVYKNLPAPYHSSDSGPCLDTNKVKNPLRYSNYSYFSCISECHAEYLQNKVGCIVGTFKWEPPYCSLLQFPAFLHEAGENNFDTAVKEHCIRRCPSPCEQTKYDVKVSFGQFPSNFIGDVVRTFNLLNRTNYSMREDYLRLNLYFEDLAKTSYEQIPKYQSFGDVFANVGGQMGLFLGASVLTLVEILEFIGTVIMIIFTKMTKSRIT